MTKIAALLCLVLTLFAFTHSATAAVASLPTRAWVSGKGADTAGCGPSSQPCRTFQYVHDNIIAAGGEIDVLDPAGYGAVTITKALSIVNDGVGTAGVQASSGANAITINAGASDIVHLRGLTIEGNGIALNGIMFNSGATLDIVNCIIRHFTQNGVNLAPTDDSAFSITNTFVSDNAGVGIFIDPQGFAAINGVINGVTAKNNYDGILLDTANSTEIASQEVTIVNSIAANNKYVGFYCAASTQSTARLVLRNVVAQKNASYGIKADNQFSNIYLAHSTIGYDGVYNNGGQIFSYGDNQILGASTGVTQVSSN
jgi:Right handed beta helix region